MNKKFILVALVVIITSIVVYYYKTTTADKHQISYIDKTVLEQEYRSIDIVQSGATINLQKDAQGYWYIGGDEAFLVDSSKIYDMLKSLSDMWVVREIAADEEQLTEYDLAEEPKSDSSKQLVIKLSDDQKTTEYIFGDINDTKGKTGRFFRFSDSTDVYLVNKAPVMPAKWQTDVIVRWSEEELKKITVKHKTSTSFVQMDTTSSWQVEGKKTEPDSIQIDGLVRFVDPLRVMSFKKMKLSKRRALFSIIYETQDDELLILRFRADNKKKPIFNEDSYLLSIELENPLKTESKKIMPYLMNRVFEIHKYELDQLRLDFLDE